MTPRPVVLAALSREAWDLVFDDARRARLQTLAAPGDPVHAPALDAPTLDDRLAAVEVLVTGWGAPVLDAPLLDRLPRLRAVFHAAGSVRGLVSEAFWERDILLTSAAEANAAPVAEYTLAMILLAGKRALLPLRADDAQHDLRVGPRVGGRIGNLDRTVGIVGFSRIGRRVVDLLRPFPGLEVLVADPYADPEEVAAAGARLVPLDALLPAVDLLSLHAPALPATRGMIGRAQLAALRDGATVLNTARGALLDHEALLAECAAGRLDAILDVTDPEPLPPDHPLLHLPNVAVTPHLAGSLGTEAHRLADAALDELEAWVTGLPPRHPVHRADLAHSA
ncbi:hydroxyacid dehydrogenase [Microbacterium paraoxydans]|uniref:Phosphoglycerate dehydrogenase n=1 Tax=Microbacterium paraoxydans TaxID=199592 RepID=A0A1H1R8C4_9MICO|nr:hydroxyacid dehydrogenase [Microbacterium paraoxydans]SDS32027.1 Phosphoglycerate dehydrogenase [Microbacterium paraoxydans]